MAVVTVTIGRNVGLPDHDLGQKGQPLHEGDWFTFRVHVRDLVAEAAEAVYTVADAAGEWQGEAEDSFLVVAEVPERRLERLEHRLERAAGLFGQECIALTVGETRFVCSPVEASGLATHSADLGQLDPVG